MVSATQNTLAQLKEQHETLVCQREICDLTEEVRALELAGSQVFLEDWGDRVDTREYLTDTPGFFPGATLGHGHISRPDDHKQGDNVPFWRTEIEHATIRGMACVLSEIDEIAIGVMENLTNYVIGEEGFSYTCEPQGGDERLASACQAIVDEFLEANDFIGELDRDLFRDSRREGEQFIHLEDRGGHVEARIEEPDFITEPNEARKLEDMLDLPAGLCWKYGIATDVGNVRRVHGYFVQRFGNNGDWEFVDPGHMAHIKIGVGRNVKRGMSDFYAPAQNLRRASKVVRFTAQGAAAQASIAYIKQHAKGTTKTDVESAQADRISGHFHGRRDGGGQTTEKFRDIHGGRIIQTSEGIVYHAGPMGNPKGQTYMEVAAAVHRVIGARWNMPEYMVAGDASNANFSSTLVAESPFVKSAGAKQGYYRRQYVSLLWKVIAIVRARHSVLRGLSIAELRRAVEIVVKVPDIAVRDRTQDHTIRKEQHEAGILSLESWAEEEGIDFEQEVKRGAKRQEPSSASGPFGAGPGPRLGESLSEDCGTGDGGFKGGNDCAAGDGSSEKKTPSLRALSQQESPEGTPFSSLTSEEQGIDKEEFLQSYTGQGSSPEQFEETRQQFVAWSGGEKSEIVDSIYADTQAKLKRDGITGFDSHRGVNLESDHPIVEAIRRGELKKGDTVRITNSGVASWSQDSAVARSFATQDLEAENRGDRSTRPGVVFSRRIAAEDVISGEFADPSSFHPGERELISRSDGGYEVTISDFVRIN